MSKFSLCLMAAVAGLGSVPAAAAETQTETVTGVVDVRDLDFTRTSDLTRFERRVRQQARLLCETGSRTDLSDVAAEAACVSSVKQSAQRQLPQLVAASRAQAGVRLASNDF